MSEKEEMQSEAGEDFELSQVCGIGWAIKKMWNGERCQREGWNGPGQSIQIQLPENTDSEMTKPFVYINTVDGHRVPWLASQTDLLATDWRVV